MLGSTVIYLSHYWGYGKVEYSHTTLYMDVLTHGLDSMSVYISPVNERTPRYISWRHTHETAKM